MSVQTAAGVHSVAVEHNFESAHRLPHLGGKCANLHGHSWRVQVTVAGPALSTFGTLVEFGALKKALRGWIDTYLDHGTMLGARDPLLDALVKDGTKLYVFGAAEAPLGAGFPCDPHALADTDGLDWPTVEHVAVLLGRVATRLLARPAVAAAAGAAVTGVRVTETAVNTAEWTCPR